MTRIIYERSDVVLALAEVFRRHGFEGASLSIIEAETGLGRGSLYHFFPKGKSDMANAVLDGVQEWFDREVYDLLRSDADPDESLGLMFERTARYFVSRQCVCLFAAIALGHERERFAVATRGYFADWVSALTATLQRAGLESPAESAIDTVSAIQGALILSRAIQDSSLFPNSLNRMRLRLLDDMHERKGISS